MSDSDGTHGQTFASLVVVHDHRSPCPYLPNREARMPLEYSLATVSATMLDQLLQQGYRRSGNFFYKTKCDACSECQPTRVPIDRFNLTASMRRVLSRGDRELRFQTGPPLVSDERLRLYNLHRKERNLDVAEGEQRGDQRGEEDYVSFLVDTSCPTRELTLWQGERLVAVAVTDVGMQSLSLVYCYFDPQLSRYSLGTYSILKHIELARRGGHRFVYLGMYVAGNRHLSYKARYQPQERFRDGQWMECE